MGLRLGATGPATRFPCRAWLGRGLFGSSPTMPAAARRSTIPAAAAARARTTLLAARTTAGVRLARALTTGTGPASARARALLASAPTGAAILTRALDGFADRAAGSPRDADAERPRPDPQESALALFDRRDHCLGAGQPQRLESLLHCLVERLAFINRTSHRIAFAGRACVAHRSPARER